MCVLSESIESEKEENKESVRLKEHKKSPKKPPS